MKSVVLNGVVVKIGDQVRFVNDANMYSGESDIKMPELGKVYTVRGFSDKGGFLLEEVENLSFIWFTNTGEEFESEPGFAIWRFEPANPLIAEVKAIAKAKKKINVKIDPEVIETLEEVLEYVN